VRNYDAAAHTYARAAPPHHHQYQILGTGALTKSLTVKAAAFSTSAKAAIEAAGGTCEIVPGPVKWTKKAYKAALKANPNLPAENLAIRVAKLQAKGRGKKTAERAEKAAAKKAASA
jgi:hypothetical protein